MRRWLLALTLGLMLAITLSSAVQAQQSMPTVTPTATITPTAMEVPPTSTPFRTIIPYLVADHHADADSSRRAASRPGDHDDSAARARPGANVEHRQRHYAAAVRPGRADLHIRAAQVD